MPERHSLLPGMLAHCSLRQKISAPKHSCKNLAIQLQHLSENSPNCKRFSQNASAATRSLSPPRRSNQTATFVGPMIFVRVLGRKPLLSGHELEAMRAASLHQSESVGCVSRVQCCIFQPERERPQMVARLCSKLFYLCKSYNDKGSYLDKPLARTAWFDQTNAGITPFHIRPLLHKPLAPAHGQSPRRLQKHCHHQSI